MIIDINCDMGEGAGQDELIMPYISSASIACGAHAGDVETMAATVRLALRHGVGIGAHPGFRDRENFGRVKQDIAPADAADLVMEQIAALDVIARSEGARLRHVKLHGALYTMAATQSELAAAVAEAIAGYNRELVIFAPPFCELIYEAGQRGMKSAREAFADRRYSSDGELLPRSDPRALIVDPVEAVAQALSIVHRRYVVSVDGVEVPMPADTVCIHGDTPGAGRLAEAIAGVVAKGEE